MFENPQAEHQWLERFLGEWIAESECQMGPDQPTVKSTAEVTCRSIGGLWISIESEGASEETGVWKTTLTAGYDSGAKQYVGTFVASMMAFLWIYSGSIDDSGKKLILNSEGPKCDKTGTAKYQDILEWVDEGHWIFNSLMLGEDGVWHSLATTHHRRKK